MSEITEEMNFHKMVLDKSKTRKHMESRGRDGQKKQAEDVNKGRGGDEGPIPRWTVCTITMPKDRDKMTPNHLPALICNTFKYKTQGQFGTSVAQSMVLFRGHWVGSNLIPSLTWRQQE